MIEITLENICQVCGKKGCKEPCKKWYDLFEGKTVDFGLVEEGEKK